VSNSLQKRRLLSLSAVALSSCLAVGCAQAQKGAQPSTGDSEIFGYSSEGKPIQGRVLGSGQETCLLVGVVHGNEPLGTPLLERLGAHLAENRGLLSGKRVIVLPLLNPDGLERGTRLNARGVDLNRNFPSHDWTPHARHGSRPASEPETRTLLRVIDQFRPTRILSVHSPLSCVNYDGPAEAMATEMAERTGYPLRPSIGYPTPGSLGNYAGSDLKIATITLELPPDLLEEDAWPQLRRALEGFVAFDESTPQTDGALPSSQTRSSNTGK
jgi:protein MpaA